MTARLLFSTLTYLLLLNGVTIAQDSPPESTPPQDANDSEASSGSKKVPPKPNGIKKYDEVITEDAESDPGLFLVHRVDDKLYYEVPVEVIGKPMLLVTQIAGTTAGYSYAGMPAGDRVVRWEFRDAEETVLLRDVNYTIRADADDPINDAVVASSIEPIIATFKVQAYGKDKSMVIDVTSLFTSDVAELSVKDQINAAGADSKRSFIEEVKSFPENIEAKILLTYKPKGSSSANPFLAGGGNSDSITVQVRYSMVVLPSDPMKPRRFDARVGFFNVGFEDYSSEKHQVENIKYVTRWRLVKKDPEADISDPVKPIVFYVSREVPEKWKPYVKKGIEAWQPAFEKAGFSNAILAGEPPTPQEDPDWDPEDARISSIRWLPSTTENAFGPHVHDPRTGEILEADVRMYHNVIKLCRDWYFIQASPSDERARDFPMPDDLMGELIAYVVAHEVGHSLGFPHNMKASSSYTVEQLRDPEFTKEYGTEASIMDYGRFNYVAQPGDGASLIPVVGPYDKFAVEWGYKPFPDAESFQAEKAALDAIVARQLEDPMLLFGGVNPSQDPSAQTEDLGSDSVAATELGLKNLERVASYLVEATSDSNEDYSLLQNMYDELISQFRREAGHVANVVGGFIQRNAYYGDADSRFTPVPVEKQREAVAFLLEHAFQTPKYLVDSEITLRLEANGAVDRILSMQQSLLDTLMRESRLGRMAEHATRTKGEAYRPIDLIKDLTDGIFTEVENDDPVIDLYRRNLQRAYSQMLIDLVKEESGSDLSALARGELVRIGQLLEASDDIEETNDLTTLYHLQDIAARIDNALDLDTED